MKLNEEELALRAENVIKNAGMIIETFGDRDPGSKGEREATEYLQKEFESYVDRTEIQQFGVIPKLFMGIGTYCMIFDLIAIVFYWIIPWLGFFFSFLGLLMFLLVGWFYSLFLDYVLLPKNSQNLMSIKKPKGEVRKRIVIHGHIDASYEMRFQLIGRKLYISLVIAAISFVLITFIISTLNLIFNAAWNSGYQSGWMVMGIILSCLSPISIPTFFFYNYKVVSSGANDDLSGALVVLEVAKICKEKNLELDSTEIIYLITGSEEAGTRGAKHFADKNNEMLSSVETIFISLDVLADAEKITALSSDHNGMVKLDKGIQDLLSRVAEERNIKLRILPFPPGAGSTDAARFQKAGFRAGSILAVDHDLPAWYHTRKDTTEVMDKDCLAKVIDLMLATFEIYDKE